jgi:enoyl-CoA hydratase
MTTNSVVGCFLRMEITSQVAIAEGEEAATGQFLPELQAIIQSEDIKEGLLSFIERRQANFQGR